MTLLRILSVGYLVNGRRLIRWCVYVGHRSNQTLFDYFYGVGERACVLPIYQSSVVNIIHTYRYIGM